MARPERNTVDYFPYYVDEGKKMFYLEETYGNDGFATFIKILKELAKTEYHYLDLSKNTTQMFLSAKCKVSKQILISIINDLAELDKFDKKLWTENSIIWCQDFIDSIQDAYKKRNNDCITLEGLLILLKSLGILNESLSELEVSVNPQRKEKKIKEDKTIWKYNEFYDAQISKQGVAISEKYIAFIDYLFGNNKLKEKLAGILSIPNQLTEEQFNKILERCDANKIKMGDILTKIENDKKYYKGKKSLYLTMSNWADGRFNN